MALISVIEDQGGTQGRVSPSNYGLLLSRPTVVMCITAPPFFLLMSVGCVRSHNPMLSRLRLMW